MSRFLRKKMMAKQAELNSTCEALCLAFHRKELDGRQYLFEECQNAAIELGTMIEQMQGDNRELVHELEHFCESVYHFCIHLEEEETCRLIADKLDQTIKIIQEKLECRFPDKWEIVFLPYKATMWDSLESIYLAAREEPDIEALVVPVPYYEKDQSGNRGELICDRASYPPQIPVINWEDYDLSLRKPDMIFIHNPYDDRNRVTSVHPDFFARELIKHTETLVYVPYFVLKEVRTNDYQLTDDFRQYCFLPGTIYAHYVFLQSEEMKKLYCKEFNRFCRENNFPFPLERLEEKFIGTGSPKFDQILNRNEAVSDLPPQWEEIIKGNGEVKKKVVFYNTSVVALLTHKEEMLNKIQNVLSIFKENQETTVLFWRPHPLYRSTIKAMLPELSHAYDKIVRIFETQGWGILDESSDLSRAIAVSDAYYGDDSSVVELFRKTGKPVLLQNVQVDRPEETVMPAYEASVLADGRFWFVPLRENALYSFEPNRMQIRYHGKFPKENGQKLLYSCIVPYGDKLFFVPKLAQTLAVYDTKTGVMEQLEVFGEYELRTSGALFGSAVCENGSLYLIPVMFRFLVQVNPETYEMQYYDLSFGETDAKVGSEIDHVYCFRNMVLLNHKLYLPLFTDRVIAVFDMQSHSLSKIKPSGLAIAVDDLYFMDELFYLISCEDHTFTVWDLAKDRIVDQFALPEDFSPPNYNYYLSAYYDARIYLFHMSTGKVMMIDIEKRAAAVKELPVLFGDEVYWNEFYKVCRVWVKDGRLTFMSGIDGAQYSLKAGEALELSRRYEPVSYEEGTLEKMLEQGAVTEQRGTPANLEDYLMCDSKGAKAEDPEEQLVGYRILQYLREKKIPLLDQ